MAPTEHEEPDTKDAAQGGEPLYVTHAVQAHDDPHSVSTQGGSLAHMEQPHGDDPLAGQRLTRKRRDIELLKINGESGNIKESTRAINMRIQRAIWQRCIDDLAGENQEVESMLTASQITNHFIDLAKNLVFTQSTYERYRTAMISELQRWIETTPTPEERQDYINARNSLLDPKHKPENIFYGISPAEAAKSRQRHEKKISRGDIKKIYSELEKANIKGRETLCFVRATIATGLRPSEWENASINGNGALETKRTKVHKHIPAYQRTKMASSVAGRTITNVYEADQILIEKFGEIPDLKINEIRTIDIPDDERAFVIEHLANVAEAKSKGIEGFSRFQERCSKYLYQAVEKLLRWPPPASEYLSPR